MFDRNYVNYKINYKDKTVIRSSFTRGGSLRCEYFKLHSDNLGYYIIRRKNIIYLDDTNCCNFVDNNG